MSNFRCGKCGKDIIDSPNGYITGCKHYPLTGTGSKYLKKTKGTKREIRSILKDTLDRAIDEGYIDY